MQLIRVAIADTQLAFAEALAVRLQTEPEVDVAFTVRSTRHLRQLLSRRSVDVLTLELTPDVDESVAVIEEVTRQSLTNVLVLSEIVDRRIVVNAFRAGARGWLSKDSGVGDLMRAIRAASVGQSWISPSVLGPLIEDLVSLRDTHAQLSTRLSTLTERERIILEFLVEGNSRQQIAARLGLSPNTVRTHVQHVFAKLGVHSNLEAVAVALTAANAIERDTAET
jgi:DNA-binding NarL/FixJ family response regulator